MQNASHVRKHLKWEKLGYFYKTNGDTQDASPSQKYYCLYLKISSKKANMPVDIVHIIFVNMCSRSNSG